MGVDYTPVAGAGIKVDSTLVEKFIAAGKFTQEDWDDDPMGAMEETGLNFSEGGSYGYGGDRRIYLVVPGEKLTEVVENATEFLRKLEEIGHPLQMSDLVMIEDIHIW